jgi:hypothetical protein
MFQLRPSKKEISESEPDIMSRISYKYLKFHDPVHSRLNSPLSSWASSLEKSVNLSIS